MKNKKLSTWIEDQKDDKTKEKEMKQQFIPEEQLLNINLCYVWVCGEGCCPRSCGNGLGKGCTMYVKCKW